MPQAVQNPLTIPTQSSISSSRSWQTKSSDGPSFQDTLDEVQNKDAEPAEDDAARAQKTNSAKPSTTTKSSKKEPVKKGQAANARKETKGADKPAKEVEANDASDGDEQPSPEDQQASTSEDQGEAKPDKKKAVEPTALTTPVVDTVQLQSAATPPAAQPVAQQAPPQPPDSKGQKKSVAAIKAQPEATKGKPKDSGKAQPSANAADPQQDAQAGQQADDNSQQPEGGKPVRGGKQALAIQPRKSADTSNDAADTAATQNAAVNLPANAVADVTDSAASEDAPVVAAGPHAASRAPDDLLLKTPGPETATPSVPAKPADLRSAVANTADPSAAAGAAPEAQFADANHSRIVAGIHGQLLPNGGSMHIRLDPPELGSLHVRVEMRDGVMTASFETTNDHATRLLSHSLSDLKTALESQGVNVDKLQVRQSPKDQQSSSGDDRQPDRSQDQARQQEQQRKEMVRRMWQKLMNGSDPLDLVA